jgi:hypothetical protein
VTIDDGLTQGTKVIGHALHLTIVVTDTEVTLLQGVEPSIELQNTRLAIAEELTLDHKARLACSLHWLPNDLVVFGGEGSEDPCHHDVVQSSPIDGWICDIREDMVIKGIAMKHEEHEVMPPLVVGRRGFQNDRDHRSYIFEAGSLSVQVRGEGGVRVRAGVDGAIIIVILGDRDPLGSGELLFHMMGDGLLLLPSGIGGMLACPCLI